MARNFFRAFVALALLAYLLLHRTARAHETITFGNYDITYGWQNEPPVAGEPNGITLSITENDGHAEEEPHTEGEEHAQAESGAELVFVAPEDGAQVEGKSLEVTIAPAEGHTPAEGEHWHLYADDELKTMQAFDQPTFTLTGLADGEHTLKAVVASSDHAESENAATVNFTVVGSAAEGTPAPAEGEGDGHSHGVSSSVDVSTLTVEISYGGETKGLALEPLFGGEAGEYIARITPSRAGQYTVHLGGSLGTEAVSAEIEPEEVMGVEVLAFPGGAGNDNTNADVAAAAATARTAQIIAIVGAVTGLLGLAAGGLALARRGK